MRRDRVGFTLIELMIVMTILAAMAMTVVPVFRGSFARARADHAARDLFAEIKAAQESAVAESVEYRVYFDTKVNTYWSARPGTTDDGTPGWAPVPVPGEESIRRPDRIVLDDVTGRRGDGGDTVFLAFYPSGVSDLGRVVLRDAADRRREFIIETTGTRATLTFPENGR